METNFANISTIVTEKKVNLFAILTEKNATVAATKVILLM